MPDSLTVTSAFTTTLPAGSFTVPEILPPTLAQSIVVTRAKSKKLLAILKTERRALLDMISCFFLTCGQKPLLDADGNYFLVARSLSREGRIGAVPLAAGVAR